MTSNKSSQRGGIIDAKDLRYFARLVSKSWYVVVITMLLALVLSYLYSYKLPNIYGASTQILIKDQES